MIRVGGGRSFIHLFCQSIAIIPSVLHSFRLSITGLGSGRKLDSKEGGAGGEDMDSYSSNPSVFNFYNYLRTHPLLVRQQLATTAADSSQTVLLSGFSHGAKVRLQGGGGGSGGRGGGVGQERERDIGKGGGVGTGGETEGRCCEGGGPACGVAVKRGHITSTRNLLVTCLTCLTLRRQVASGEKNVTYVDRITPVERRLYFSTANAHFKSGCPMLALEVLQKLPEVQQCACV